MIAIKCTSFLAHSTVVQSCSKLPRSNLRRFVVVKSTVPDVVTDCARKIVVCFGRGDHYQIQIKGQIKQIVYS